MATVERSHIRLFADSLKDMSHVTVQPRLDVLRPEDMWMKPRQRRFARDNELLP